MERAWVGTESHPRAPPSARTERARCTHGLHACTCAHSSPDHTCNRAFIYGQPLDARCIFIRLNSMLHFAIRARCGRTGVHNFSSTLNSNVNRSQRYYFAPLFTFNADPASYLILFPLFSRHGDFPSNSLHCHARY